MEQMAFARCATFRRRKACAKAQRERSRLRHGEGLRPGELEPPQSSLVETRPQVREPRFVVLSKRARPLQCWVADAPGPSALVPDVLLCSGALLSSAATGTLAGSGFSAAP